MEEKLKRDLNGPTYREENRNIQIHKRKMLVTLKSPSNTN